MYIIISIMFGGIGIGYLLRRIAFLRHLNTAISYTIYLLLFLLGVSVGTNQTIMTNLATLGWDALLLAIAATLGSVLAGWGVYVFFYKKRGTNE